MKKNLKARVAVLALSAAPIVACGTTFSLPRSPGGDVAPTLEDLRSRAASSHDPDLVGRWALSELVVPGGDAEHEAAARRRLDTVAREGLYPSLARGVADEAHGDPRAAAEAYVAALRAAQTSEDPDAGLIAWVATHRILALRGSVANLYGRYEAALKALLAKPQNLGWRAVADLAEWRVAEIEMRAESAAEGDAPVAKRLGCSTAVRLAGPFGYGSPLDRRRPFPAERPAPWPAAWAEDPLRGTVPRVLKVQQHDCDATSSEAVQNGVFYAETFFTTSSEREVLVAVQGAVKVWVDDVPVLERDPHDWGSWQRFGAAVFVREGRHRVLARTPTPKSSIRLLNLDGTGANVETDGLADRPYTLVPPRMLADPNLIDGAVRTRATGSPLHAFLVSSAAHMDGMDDVATVLGDPLVARPDIAAPVALLQAAVYASTDPALPNDLRDRNARTFREAALRRDPRLWEARLRLVIEDAEHRGLAEGVEPLRKLSEEFRGEPAILVELARIYGRLGWRGERMRALADLATRFPDNEIALRMYLEAIDADGALADADKVAARIKKLDPDAEVDLDRALARRDWKAAVAELRRLVARRPDRKEITGRIAEVLARAGDPSAAADQLEKSLKAQPQDAQARFRLADRAYAKGESSALRRALAESLQVGAVGTELRAAIDLLEGATDLEPYRVDSRAVIKEFEAWEKAGHSMEGNAARVLDYMAVWVHPDGSSELLEHELQRIQSQEAVSRESEIPAPEGLVLRLRVIKPDGSTLEPEQVEGKPTLTLPHLEVGDYVDVEHITAQPGDGQKGKHYEGPHWFFREPDKGYWRSEFVVIAPKDRALDVEKRGEVGQEKTREIGTFVERRWRVDVSPPAPNEDASPPVSEFYPNLRVGWGISVEDTFSRLVDRASDDTPLDPRLHDLALRIVRGVPAQNTEERARLLYRYVADHVQETRESREGDGRRVLMGLSGARSTAYQHLLRQVGIPVELAVVRNRLATPPLGPMSAVENYYDRAFYDRSGPTQLQLVTRVETSRGARWLLVGNKYSPFGFIPSEMRGQPAYRLITGIPRDLVAADGAVDGLTYEGRAELRLDGSATLSLTLTVSGADGIGWRQALDREGEAGQLELIEKHIVAPMFDGGHVRDMSVENKAAVDQPLVVKLKIEAPRLGRAHGQDLSIPSVFPIGLARFAALPPTRRQTPILRPDSLHVAVHFEVVVPETTRMPASPPPGQLKFDGSVVSVSDSIRGHALYLERQIDIPAGRVQPGEEYARYHQFMHEADALLEREIVIGR